MLEDPCMSRRTDRFTLQWHITHACELHCAHCYDRSKVAGVKLEQGLRVLDELAGFCAARGLTGGVCFSGGNPFLHPRFEDLWAAAVKRGLRTSILGNPVDDEALDRICAIRKPGFFQVSLEGLREHNDRIRGAGFYDKVMAFLPKLRARKIQSVVMATLTRDNLEQLIPLARELEGRVDRFAFNRLAQVGEGAALAIPDRETYGRFLIDWMAEGKKNPALVYKDNLFNIFRHELGQRLYGGCTGFGCGAAFNFLALLPHGELHACRKLPSPVGDLRFQTLGEAYDSEIAARYRRGCTACDGCAIRHRCGGCLAVSYGHGQDPFEERDPHCFMYC